MELSDHALKLAKKNMAHNLRLGNLEPRAAREIVFMKHNILDEFPSELGDFDLVISNPPYATPDEYHSSAISKSVRCYEPVEALVPDETPNPDSVPGHTYFTAIDKIAQRTRAKAVIIEMGLEEQFAHVCSELQASPGYWSKVEVWRDQVYSGLLQREPQRELVVLDDGRGLRVHVHSLGIGFYRVVIGINKGWSWLNEQPDIVKSMDKAR
jgi:methylase of polypeptide subunit release factors